MIKVFISHTSADHSFVEWLKTKLERENLGFDIFIDDGSLFVGDDPQKMIDEVKKSIIFLPILSNESIQKEFVQNEIKTAFANGTTHVFPIKLKCDDANIPDEFRTKFIACDKVEGKIYEDFSDEQEWDIHYEHLRRAIFNKILELSLFKEDTKDYYQDCELLDLILQRDEPTILEIKTVIDVYLKKEAYQRYFFGRLTNIRWLKYLRFYGFLRSNPQPIEDVNSPGLFRIPQWDALVYLERVSSQAGISDIVINDLLDIIASVTSIKDSSGQHIDNYRTWYYFTKILVNLPTEKIPEEIINLIPVWLDSKFSTSLHGAEIAGKLLAKVLNSDKPDDWKKAERLIDIITDIKWVPLPEAQRNIHERDVEAKTVIEPHWLRKGFERNFERIGIVCSIGIIEALAKKVLRIFSRQYDHSYDVTYKDKDYQITHALLEDGQHQISVHSLKYPEDWAGFSRSKVEKTLVTSFMVSGFENRVDFAGKVKEGVKNAFPSLSTEFDEPISAIYTLHDYTYIGYNSLWASLDDVHIDDEKILLYILKEILSKKAHQNIDGTRELLDKFLSKEYPYPFFKRLVLFVAGREWDKYKEYFFKLLSLEELRCFEESDYAKELSILLKENFSKFSHDEKDTVRRIVEAGPKYLPKENPDKHSAYWKQKWFSIMKSDPVFAPLFEEQQKLTGIETEKFDFGSEVKVSHGFGESPLSVEEILKLSSNELAVKLKEFRSEKKLEGITVEALAGTLKEAAKVNPEKFTDSLSSFEEVGFIYIYKIFDGLKETWKEKKAINWGKVFEFVMPYIKKEQFWKDVYVIEPGSWLGGADHHWVTTIVAELIQEGTGDDAWAFPEDYFDKAKEIIFSLIEEPEEEKEEIKDYVFHTLNTPCGKLITAMVYLALRVARVNDKKGVKNDLRWSEDYRNKFDELLNKKVIDAHTSLGRFLPYLAYLDRNWVTEKIRRMVSDSGSKPWAAFFEGYLSIGRVYDDLYEMMTPHYQYAISYDFKEKRNREHLIQHVCIAHLRGREQLTAPEGLFRQLVDEWRPDQIREVIGFFWMQRDYLKETTEENEKMKEKIIDFWKLVYEKYKGKDEGSLTREDKQSLSTVSKLAALLPEIEPESFEWLMASAPYVHEDFNSPFFIEYLDELKDKGDRTETAKYIGDVYLKMLEKFTPDFDQKHIRSIVEFLYYAGETDSSNKICNTYGARGQEFLRDIYEKHEKKT